MTDPKTPTASEDGAAEKRIERYLKIGVPIGTLVLSGAAGATQGPALAILVLAGGALIAVIATFWSSVRTLFGETPLSGADAYALGAPRAEEEQKQAVLRALKDLEFERSVGKISDEDYKALVAKYREEAKRLLRLLDADAQPHRAHVEALVTKRLRREGLLDGAATEAEEETANDADGDADDADDAHAKPHADDEPVKPQATKLANAKKKRGGGAKAVDLAKKPLAAKANRRSKDEDVDAAAAGRACASCSAVNDEDAAFCKKCGARLGVVAARASRDEDAAETPDDGAGA